MSLQPIQKSNDLITTLISLTNQKSWDDVKLNDLDALIIGNANLILKQEITEDKKNRFTTSALNEALIALSDRISRHFATPEARTLSNRIIDYAKFIMHEGPTLKTLIPEMQKEILSWVLSKDSPVPSSGLKSAATAIRELTRFAAELKRDWVEEKVIPLRIYGCRMMQQAIKCIKDRHLTSVNLEGIFPINNESVKGLITECPYIKHLIIKDAPDLYNPSLLSELPLISLELSDCNIFLLYNLPNLAHLTSLTINPRGRIQNVMTFKGLIEIISKLPNLLHLNIDNACYTNNVGGIALFEEIKKLQKLKHLNVGYLGNIEETVLSDLISSLPDLKILDVNRHLHIQGKHLAEALLQKPGMTHLDLGFCFNIQDIELPNALKTLTKLTYLNLFNCSKIPGTELAAALNELKNITHLSLCNCSQIPQEELTEAIMNMNGLISLDLSGCQQISAYNLAKILAKFPNLTTLKLNYIFISEKEMSEILSKLPNLMHLEIVSSNGITGKTMNALKNLRWLDLSKTRFSRKYLQELWTSLPHLQYLKLEGCPGIESGALDHLINDEKVTIVYTNPPLFC